MRIRHIGGAVFGLILICVFAYLISDYLPSDRPFRNGKEIADLLIADARKHNGIPSLSIISEKVCVQPDGEGPWRAACASDC